MADGNSKVAYNLTAEQCVLGCLMLDYADCEGGIDNLRPDDFYLGVHKTILTAMKTIVDVKNKTIDLVTVTDALKAVGKFEACGGLQYLNTISDTVPSVANFRHYLEIVKKDSTLRKLNKVGREIVDISLTSDDGAIALQKTEKLIFDISKEDEKNELRPIAETLPAVAKRVNALRNDPTAYQGIMTDFYDIDEITNGFRGGELIILAARPSVGKTAFGLNIVTNIAVKTGKRCAVFSLEMSREQLVNRMACSFGCINSYNVGRGELTEEEWNQFVNTIDILSMQNIFIDDSSDIGPAEIRRKCERLKRTHGLDFVMVDYLGLMNTDSQKRDNRQVEVAACSRAMKILAKELDVPVLLLAQLNRSTENTTTKNEDKEPELHNLRESGAIEQDADIVMFIHKPKQKQTDGDDQTTKNEPQEIKIKIAKHRNGPTGAFNLVWESQYTRFSNTKSAQEAQDEREKAIKQRKNPKKAPAQQKILDGANE